MDIEIVAIGNEILSGFIVNSNASYISQELLKAGYQVSRHSVLPDSAVRLRQGLKEALERNQLVITTGGLGPTCDDITRSVAAELFQSDFQYNEQLGEELRRRYPNCLETLENQATVPTKAKLLKNEAGTAPGFIFNSANSTLVLLPGIPAEMKAMFPQVLAHLSEHLPIAAQSYCKRLNLFNVTEASADPILRKLQDKFSTINFGIYPAQGILGIHLTILSRDKTAALSQLELAYKAITSEFPGLLFESGSRKIEEALHQRFIEKKLTLSAAESCTGGSFSARLTQLPGASHYFIGSIVSYSNEMKSHWLGVSEQLLKEKGAVSAEVVTQMLKGLLAQTRTDYGVAVSGIAGPEGGTADKPVGTIWCAVGKRGEEPRVWKLQAYGTREMIIERSVNALIAELLMLSAKDAA